VAVWVAEAGSGSWPGSMKCPVALTVSLAGCPSLSSTLHARHCHRPCCASCALQAVSGSLGQQRTVFEGVGGKLQSLGSKFPVVNSLMNAIRRRKNRVGALQLQHAGSCNCTTGYMLADCRWSQHRLAWPRSLAPAALPQHHGSAHSWLCPLALHRRTT
jgi:hypothetical protein